LVSLLTAFPFFCTLLSAKSPLLLLESQRARLLRLPERYSRKSRGGDGSRSRGDLALRRVQKKGKAVRRETNYVSRIVLIHFRTGL